MDITSLGAKYTSGTTAPRMWASLFEMHPRHRRFRAITARVLTREEDAILLEERVARMQIGLIHAAATTPTDIETLASIPLDALNSMMLRRLADLWQMDLNRYRLAEEEKQSIRTELVEAQARLKQLESRLAALSSDSALNDIALTRKIISLKEQLSKFLR